MAKETAPQSAPNPFTAAAAPLFALTRSALTEFASQSERFIAHGNAQAAEGHTIGRALQQQALAASKALCDAAEANTRRLLDGMASFAPAGQGA
ncbi:MAG: hypothetical protein EXR72_22375 [Myxococcales bacterium]|nr:hypothetical protein [Myxococcales bacterium]